MIADFISEYDAEEQMLCATHTSLCLDRSNVSYSKVELKFSSVMLEMMSSPELLSMVETVVDGKDRSNRERMFR